MPFAPVSLIYSSGKAFCGSTRFWPKLSINRWDHLDLDELKQTASNDEAGLVRLAALRGKPAALGMLHAAGLGVGSSGR